VYSRVIAWLKILLPLAALALLSTLFLFSRSTEPLATVPFADALQRGETARQQVVAPYYAGTTPRGDLLTMTAESVRPMIGGAIKADALETLVQFSDGSEIRMNADTATLMEAERRALLDGGVRIISSTGYVMQTDSLTSDLDALNAESRGAVIGHGPAGRLEAGKMRISASGPDGVVQLLFTEGVKLVYQPPKQESSEP
jgi:lipopolysaccharide export system protein LptC